jgi:hypothetical protein
VFPLRRAMRSHDVTVDARNQCLPPSLCFFRRNFKIRPEAQIPWREDISLELRREAQVAGRGDRARMLASRNHNEVVETAVGVLERRKCVIDISQRGTPVL